MTRSISGVIHTSHTHKTTAAHAVAAKKSGPTTITVSQATITISAAAQAAVKEEATETPVQKTKENLLAKTNSKTKARAKV